MRALYCAVLSRMALGMHLQDDVSDHTHADQVCKLGPMKNTKQQFEMQRIMFGDTNVLNRVTLYCFSVK